VQYDVEVGGRIRRVALVRSGVGFAITVDDRPYHVDAARTGTHALSLLVDTGVAGDPQSFEVALADDGRGGAFATVNGIPIPVAVNRRRGGGGSGGAAPEGPRSVTAPMPGRVVRVLVSAGDRVAARQPVVVVEAMKMENELRAAGEGTVAEVRAREGESVEAGALLVVIEP